MSDERSTAEDDVMFFFRKAVIAALTLGMDPELLADDVRQIWRDEFEGGEGDDGPYRCEYCGRLSDLPQVCAACGEGS